MKICGIDPGTEKTAFVLWDTATETVIKNFTDANEKIIADLRVAEEFEGIPVIEGIQHMGMPIGKSVLMTENFIGHLQERLLDYTEKSYLVYRGEIKCHFCGSARAQDTNIKQALIDRFGAIGTKKEPGKFYAVHGHEWSALAVAIYFADNREKFLKEVGNASP